MTATVSTPTIAVSRTADERTLPLAGTYTIDASHTHVGFAVRHLMLSKTRGRFPTLTGTIVIGDDPLASSVDVSIETAGVDTGDERRDGHLRSPDFFDVERFPAITYHGTAVVPGEDGGFEVLGDLTVRDVTRPVRLRVDFDGAVTDPMGNVRAGFTASAEIDREDFGLTWNQALEGGGVLVGKKVVIEIEAEAVLDA